MTFTLLLLTSESMHAESLPRSIGLPTLVLIAQAIFLLACGHTNTQADIHTDTHQVTDATDHLPTSR